MHPAAFALGPAALTPLLLSLLHPAQIAQAADSRHAWPLACDVGLLVPTGVPLHELPRKMPSNIAGLATLSIADRQMCPQMLQDP
jgi:hypothetical protein